MPSHTEFLTLPSKRAPTVHDRWTPSLMLASNDEAAGGSFAPVRAVQSETNLALDTFPSPAHLWAPNLSAMSMQSYQILHDDAGG